MRAGDEYAAKAEPPSSVSVKRMVVGPPGPQREKLLMRLRRSEPPMPQLSRRPGR